VRSSIAVFFVPFFGKGTSLTEIGEEVGIKDGFPVHAVGSFDVFFLLGPSGLNKLNLDFKVVAAPFKFL